MTSHLVEGLKIVKAIAKNKSLMKFIRKDDKLKKPFVEVKKYLPRGENSDLISKFARLRGNVIFHYADSGLELEKSFRQTFKDDKKWKSLYFPSNSRDQLCHFKFAEDILDACFLRAMDESYSPKDSQKIATDLAAKRDKALSVFCQFAQPLVVKYLKAFPA